MGNPIRGSIELQILKSKTDQVWYEMIDAWFLSFCALEVSEYLFGVKKSRYSSLENGVLPYHGLPDKASLSVQKSLIERDYFHGINWVSYADIKSIDLDEKLIDRQSFSPFQIDEGYCRCLRKR